MKQWQSALISLSSGIAIVLGGEGKKELEKQLQAERRRVFLDLDRYEQAKKQIEQKMMEGENQPFSHPYYWSSVICQGL